VTSTSAGPKATSVYLRCETEANVARNILANAHGSLGPPGDVNTVIASGEKQSAAVLLRAGRDNKVASDRALAGELDAAAASLTKLSREAAATHSRMPTSVLRAFARATAAVDAICPPSG
jgi:hypothetical protein